MDISNLSDLQLAHQLQLISEEQAKRASIQKFDESWLWWGAKKSVKVGVVAGVSCGVVAAAPILLGAASFGSAGVTAGSLAAGILSAIYGGAVASGSTFAVLQSAGAAGIGMSSTAMLGTGGGALAYKVVKRV